MNNTVLTVKSIFDQAHEIVSPSERQAFLDTACAGNPLLRQQVEALLEAFDRIRSGTFMQTPAGGLGSTGQYLPAADTPAATPLDENATVPPQPGIEWESQVEGLGSQIGPYRLIKELGEGGMGAVYLAEQEQPIRRQVAIKIIKPGMDSAGIVARFEAERQALTMMDHPNIARVYEAGTTATGRPYFVMELVGGVPMSRFCDEKCLTVHERLALFATVCEAIQHAHAKGVMHRDIKPGNVLVAMQDGKPVPKVIDFGLAKAMGRSLTDETQLTQVGAIVGTLEYMSPEQADPSGPGVDTATDIYSLGVMLYELLTGTTPLDLARTRGSGGFMDLVVRIHTEDPPRPSDRVAALGERLPVIAEQRKIEPARLANLLRGELDWIALKPLEKDRKRRYDTASGFGRDVQHYLNDEPVEACPPTVGYRVGKFARKNRVLVWATGVVGALLLLVIVGLLVAIARESRLTVQAVAAEGRSRKSLEMTDAVVETLLRSNYKLGETEKTILRKQLTEYKSLHEASIGQATSDVVPASHVRLANLSRLIGEREDAEAATSYRIAIQQYEALVHDFPDVTNYRSQLANTYYTLGFLLQLRGKTSEAANTYRRAIELHEGLATQFPDEPGYRSHLADENNNLGVVLRELKEPKKAEEAFHRAIKFRLDLAADLPTDVGYRIALACSYHGLGNVLRDQMQPKAALRWYSEAAKQLNPIHPRTFDVLIAMRTVCWDYANALGQLGRHAAAIKQWQNAITLDDGPQRENLGLFLAAEQREALLKLQPKPTGEVFFKAAVINARARIAAIRTREPSLEDRYTMRAIDLLKQAQVAGWFRKPENLKQLKEEKSFATLPRDEFKRFLDSAEATKAEAP